MVPKHQQPPPGLPQGWHAHEGGEEHPAPKAMERVEGKDYSELIPTLKGQTAVLFAEKGNAPPR
jgi:hypothetical protein